MRNPPILESSPIDWTYEDLSEQLEHLATVEDLNMEAPAGPSLSDLPELLADDEIVRAARDIAQVAELEGL